MSDCTCFVTPESTWFRYGGAVEPGSQMEPNPDCPEHFPEMALAHLIAETLAADDTDMGPYVDSDYLDEVVLDGRFNLVRLAEVLAANGLGSKERAWNEGWEHYRKHFTPIDPEFGINPYQKQREAEAQ